MKREHWDQILERAIFAVALAIFVFAPLAFGAARLQEFLVVQLLTAVILILAVAKVWIAAKPKFLLPPAGFGVLAFLGYAVVRYLTCDVEYIGRQELLRIIVYAVVFFVALSHLHRQESIQLIVSVLSGLGTLLSFYAVYQFLSTSDQVWGVSTGYLGRGSGTYICPNHLAGFLELILPVTIAFVIAGRGKVIAKILLSYCALAMVAGIAVTGSRGSWISIGVALLSLALILLTQRSFRWPALGLIVVIALGGALAFHKADVVKKRIDMAFVGGKVDMKTRFTLWDCAVQMWRDHPWVGVGPGHYDVRFRAYRPASLQLRPERVHNDYLNALADWGGVGAGLILTTFGLLAWGVQRTWATVKRPERHFSSNQSDKLAFLIGGSASLVALLLHSVVDFNWQIPANAIVGVILMALLASQIRFATERFWISARLTGKIVASALLLVPLFYLSWQTARLGQEAILLARAQKPELLIDQAKLREAAFAIEPKNDENAYAIAEIYRLLSFDGREDFTTYATNAMQWYQRAAANNSHSCYNPAGRGMVLDFLGKHAEAEAAFLAADALDPNGYFTSAMVGRHFVESGEYAAARPWLERSLLILRDDNVLAAENLRIANERLLEAAKDPVRRKLEEQMRALTN